MMMDGSRRRRRRSVLILQNRAYTYTQKSHTILSAPAVPYALARNKLAVSPLVPRTRRTTTYDANPATMTPIVANNTTGAVIVYVPTATVYVPRDPTASVTTAPALPSAVVTPAIAPLDADALAAAPPVSDIDSATAAPVSMPPMSSDASRAPHSRVPDATPKAKIHPNQSWSIFWS